MEVDQAQAVEHARRLEAIHRVDQLLGVETKQAAVATVFAPVAIDLGAEFETHTDQRLHLELAAALDDQRHFIRGFHHKEAGDAELAGAQAEVDKFLILVAIAHDQAFAVAQHGHGHQQFRLAARLQAVVVALAEAGDLVDDMALLVHLDGEHAAINTGIAGAADRLGKGFVDLGDGGVEVVFNPQQDRHGQVALVQAIDHIHQ